MRYYCTYFDHHYLPRGLALYESMRRHGGDFQLWVLCLSETCEQILQKLNLPGVKTIPLREFEAGDMPLQAAKQNRSAIEYIFTCTPSLPLFLFKKVPAMDAVTYLDGDLYFFGSVEMIHAEVGEASIAITPHRFPPALRGFERAGIYNVGWLTFRRDANALACLEWWRERCLEWCYDREEDGRFADQKYLDCWPQKFPGVKVIEHPGVNLAPWNLSGSQLMWERGQVRVDGRPLLLFHFHGLKQLTRYTFDPRWTPYQVRPDAVLKNRIYRPYLETLASIANAQNIKPAFVGINRRFGKGGDLPSETRTAKDIFYLCRQFRQGIRRGAYLRCKKFPREPYSVGVVLVMHNGVATLEAHLAAMQKWLDLVQEVVVVDSDSRGGTLELIRKQLQHPGLRTFSRPRGLFEALNFGVSQIRSKYTYISTVGDLMTREMIEHLVETSEPLNCDVLINPSRFSNAAERNRVSQTWPVHCVAVDLKITKPRVFSNRCVFALPADYVLNHSFQDLIGTSTGNLYRTTFLQRFPLPLGKHVTRSWFWKMPTRREFFTQIYSCRKSSDGHSDREIKKMEAQLGTGWYAFLWAQYKIARPLSKLRRWIRRKLTKR